MRPRPFAALAAATLPLLAAGCDSESSSLSYIRQSMSPDPPGIIEDLPDPVPVDWDSIAARDTLRAILTFTSTGYFIYRGEPMGFEYELLTAFAEANELELATTVVRDRRDLFRLLNQGAGDVVAARVVPVREYLDHVTFTSALYTDRPTIVQRTEDVVPRGDTVQIRGRIISRPAELAGEELHITVGSDYYNRIIEISDSLGREIELIEVENADAVEPLIAAVASGQIRLTVSPEHLAQLNQERFTNLVARPVVGPTHPVVWAVRHTSPELRRRINEWLTGDEAEELRAVLYRKYFVDRQAYAERTQDDFLASTTGRISEYDSLLIELADSVGWDWRLLAAQVAQESRFDPSARSWAGARGLLQLMPRTAREMGVRNPTNPSENLAGGVRYLQWLTERWVDLRDPQERLKFILASYNAGLGHVQDARRLAEKHGDDPDDWEAVAYWLLQKSKPSVYGQDVVQHGYVRGLEPVQYVSKILSRFDRYRAVEPGTTTDDDIMRPDTTPRDQEGRP